ncbi:MAG TPA: DUF3459 domain-containing protein, partial [Caulobacteraceae bacterium]|nr:DUF3459 domain-containing protein [Caulobacteraceae bacterium]
ELLEAALGGSLDDWMADWRTGGFKLAATARLLALRQSAPALFADGDYRPVTVAGPDADAVCAFTRRAGDQAVLVVAARFPARFRDAAGPDACLETRETEIPGAWRDILQARDARLQPAPPVASLLSGKAAGVFFKETGPVRGHLPR